MARTGTLAVEGYQGLMRAFALADREQKREARKAFRRVGEVVRHDAMRRMSPIDAGSASGYRTRVRPREIAVEQSLRRTTGKRPDYGSLQMRRALLPALLSNAAETERELERALDQVADHFNRGP